jgi:hypothetical protein
MSDQNHAAWYWRRVCSPGIQFIRSAMMSWVVFMLGDPVDEWLTDKN